ncbi:MAG: hypothetical protein V4671_00740 [Armatimonadota bacterium]
MILSEQFSAVDAAAVSVDGSGGFTVSTDPETVGAGIRFAFTDAAKDWSAAKCLHFTLRANGAHRLHFTLTHGRGSWQFYLVPRPGLTSRVVIPVRDLAQRPHNQSHAGYSTFGGGPQPVDFHDVESLSITFNQVSPDPKTVVLSSFALSDEDLTPEVLDPVVVVDGYGQWIGEKGMPRNPDQIAAVWAAESTEFTGFSGQTNKTGAFAFADIAPATEGTGFFRVDQIEGRWLLRDPEGYPFFSLGCDCVNPGSDGPVGGEGREALFADLSLAEQRAAYGRGANSLWADFYKQNLRRRYADSGDDWLNAWSDQCRVRLRRWGFNTVGNWSHRIFGQRQLLPYVTNISSLNGMCAHLPDVFAPDFEQKIRVLIAPEVTPFVQDPLLIGYFVGNEPQWSFGGHRHPFNEVFTSADYPHTREKAFAWVRQAYGDDLHRLNAAWETDFATWDALAYAADSGGIPDVRLGPYALKQDADTFLGEVLGIFYDICCREIRAIDPNHLLLGGRFYTPLMAEPYVRACRSFDVYSFNHYQWDAPADAIARATALSGLPVLIGEFHYGVEGRGLTASLIGTMSQHERGLAYRHFLENLAALPQVIGAHWFQWVDQPSTGRYDGESYNIGLVDITDIPYGEFLASVQETHTRITDLCFGKAAPYTYPGNRPHAW